MSLVQSNSLKELYLGINDLGDEGVLTLCEILPQTELQILDLKFNSIEDDGATALGICMRDTKITQLDLSSMFF